MTVSLEKIFFAWILKHPKYFTNVEPHYFKNSEIQFVYKVLRKYMLATSVTSVPKPGQIREMIKLDDKDQVITNEILKSLLTTELQSYDEDNFIIPKFKSWIIKENIKMGVGILIDKTRDIEKFDYDDLVAETNSIKDTITKYADINIDTDQDESLGSDFDDPECHVQATDQYKIKSGIGTLDHILGGGWDPATLNILMAETNAGKSLWMQNLSCRAADLGHDVLYFTMEMSERKVMKRLGAMRLRIPINDFDELSKDTEMIKKRIQSIKETHGKGINLLEHKMGKIITKFFPAGTCTTADLDRHIKLLNEKRGFKPSLIVVDYITLIAASKSLNIDNNLYMKGKHLAEALRAIASKYNCPVVTAIQIAKSQWNSNDITLEAIPESKAIAETADTFFAIIRTEEMKRNNKYHLKLLKQRDGDFSKSRIQLDLNPKYLTLENDNFMDALH
jgi:archaellum biogenesis ATPase FlaH